MRHSLGQDILNNMFLFFLIIIAELQELPPVCVASLMDVLYHAAVNSQFSGNNLSAIRYLYVVFSMHQLSYTTESLGHCQHNSQNVY